MQIAVLFKVLLGAEYRLESLRRNLAIDLRIAFGHLNANEDGYVRMGDLRDFCASQGFYATERELQGCLNRFDPTRRNMFTFD